MILVEILDTFGEWEKKVERMSFIIKQSRRSLASINLQSFFMQMLSLRKHNEREKIELNPQRRGTKKWVTIITFFGVHVELLPSNRHLLLLAGMLAFGIVRLHLLYDFAQLVLDLLFRVVRKKRKETELIISFVVVINHRHIARHVHEIYLLFFKLYLEKSLCIDEGFLTG